MSSIVEWLSEVARNNALSHWIRQSSHLVIAGLQIVHVFGIILLLGALLFIGLRVLHTAFASRETAEISGSALPLVWIGLGLAVMSGVLMFITSPGVYLHNPAFKLKMALLLAAAIIQVFLFRRMTRTIVALSLILWFAVGFAGRAIAFV